MSILFGHPTGNPNSHQAALAHFEAGRLEAFCVPWFPTASELRAVGVLPGLAPEAQRLSRRAIGPLRNAPRVEGRSSEWWRMARRLILGGRFGGEGLSYEANDWLMKTMRTECRRPAVTAVHAYEDCSLWQFEEATRMGKACIYDMPIGFYPAWEDTQARLARQFQDWLPAGGLPSSKFVRPQQKLDEMKLADLVLVPSSFVERTVATYHPEKLIKRAAYGVDCEFWQPSPARGWPAKIPRQAPPLRFVYAGQLSLRKGIPVLLEAWKAAGLRNAELHMVGMWALSDERRRSLPSGVILHGPVSSLELLGHFQAADVFVFPSFFEGFGLVLLEAMACGLPAIATDATAGPDVLDAGTGRLLAAGDVDALVETLRWCEANRDALPAMGRAARAKAQGCTWEQYRRAVSSACSPFC